MELFFASTSSTARIAISSGSHSVPGQCCVTSCGLALEKEPPGPPRTFFSGWMIKSAWFELGVYTMTRISKRLLLLLLLAAVVVVVLPPLLLVLLVLPFQMHTVSPAAKVMGAQGRQGVDERPFTGLPSSASSVAEGMDGDGTQLTGGERVQRDAHTMCRAALMGWCDVMIHPSSGRRAYPEKMVAGPALALETAGIPEKPPGPSTPGWDTMGINERFIASLRVCVCACACGIFSLFLVSFVAFSCCFPFFSPFL